MISKKKTLPNTYLDIFYRNQENQENVKKKEKKYCNYLHCNYN